MSYAMVINFTLDGENQSIVLDSVEDTKVTATSNLASHPMVSGDIIVDHMIKQPVTMDFSGKFSTLNHPKTLVVNSNGTVLAEVEELFERIKNEAILCTLYKIKIDENATNYEKSARFSIRQNMVLDSITWTEQINTLVYSFSWTQLMLIDVEEFDVDVDDNFLPYVTDPETVSFTDVLFDIDQFDASIINILFDLKLIEQEFWDAMIGLGVGTLVGLGVAIAVAKFLVLVCAVSRKAALIVAAVALVICVATGIALACRKAMERNKYRIAAFQYYKNEKKMNKEIKRFGDFLEKLHNQATVLSDHISMYKVNENKQQEYLLSIGSGYYVITLVWSNTSQTWAAIATNMDDKKIGDMPNLEAALTSVNDCTKENRFFETPDGYYAYIMKPDAEADDKDLTNYYIMVSSIKMWEWQKILEDIVYENIVK